MDWPKCKKCGGLKTVPALVGNDAGAIGEMDCPACNGTGEAAELTEDEAVDYLDAHLDSWRLISDKVKGKDIRIYYFHDGGRNSLYAADVFNNFRDAANAAARAVKERRK